MTVTVRVNGEGHHAPQPQRLLLDWLRDDLGLTGTKYGCGEGECGACTVLVDGEARLACLTPVGTVTGRDITTIEGLENDADAIQIMEDLAEADAVQCGFCTPGMVVSLIGAIPPPGAPVAAIAGNLCRCTGYRPLVQAAAGVPHRSWEPRRTGAVRTAGYYRPAELETALGLLAEGSHKVMAGGTDLLVDGGDHDSILDITGLPELAAVGESATEVRIGAGVTFTRLISSDPVRRWCRPLARACREIGGLQIQNQGTIGGNIANASPAADTLPALAVLDARVELRSATHVRTLPIAQFCTGPGSTVLQPDELITAIVVPKTSSEMLSFFIKVGPRRAQAISIVSAAVLARHHAGRLHDVRVSYGAVSPVVTTDPEVGAVLESGPLSEELIRAAADRSTATPISDVRASATYRRMLLSGVLLRGFTDAGLLDGDPAAN